VTGSRDTTAVARLIHWLLHLAGKSAGLACSEGLFIDGRRVDQSNCARWDAGQRLLINRSVEAAVFETGAEMILRDGLAYDRCQVGVVTDADGADRLGEFYVENDTQLYNVLRTQVDVVLPDGAAVLNAGDPRLMPMKELCDGEVMLYAADPTLPDILTHVAEGGRAVLARNGQLVIASGRNEIVLARLSAFPCLTHPTHALSLESLLAGVGAAWALGLSNDLLVAGIITFSPEGASHTLCPAQSLAHDPLPASGQHVRA